MLVYAAMLGGLENQSLEAAMHMFNYVNEDILTENINRRDIDECFYPLKIHVLVRFGHWNEILDEMIWAFEQKTMDDWNDQYYGPFIPDEKEPLGGEFEWIDHDGLKAHQERMTKAFKLFGEYYENLWD